MRQSGRALCLSSPSPAGHPRVLMRAAPEAPGPDPQLRGLPVPAAPELALAHSPLPRAGALSRKRSGSLQNSTSREEVSGSSLPLLSSPSAPARPDFILAPGSIHRKPAVDSQSHLPSPASPLGATALPRGTVASWLTSAMRTAHTKQSQSTSQGCQEQLSG